MGAAVACTVAFDGDPRLGPVDLPDSGPVARIVRRWERFGDLTAAEFLDTYWDPDANAGRGSFGSEFGAFLAPILSGYERRAIPPQSLNTFDPAYPCNYHTYRVKKALPVRIGPIAPWFEQLGFGTQYQLDASLLPGAPSPLSVLWLVDNGYLERTN
jgi:hypothetical protein